MRQVATAGPHRFVAVGVVVVLLAAMAAGCGEDLYVGSDVMWAARHETGDFTEWTNAPGGRAVTASPNTLEVTREHAHSGNFAARISISAPPDATQTSANLIRGGNLPSEAYYSAWYYIPAAVTVGEFWVIMKFRIHNASGDEAELLDLDLRSTSGGELVLYLYDHRIAKEYPLDGPNPMVPIGSWFQIEAFYRDAQDATGRATYWLDGRQILDMTGQAMSPMPWVEWDVGSVGQNLNPPTALLYVDDAAISRSRVSPAGAIVR